MHLTNPVLEERISPMRGETALMVGLGTSVRADAA
jgi:hypothetical protein